MTLTSAVRRYDVVDGALELSSIETIEVEIAVEVLQWKDKLITVVSLQSSPRVKEECDTNDSFEYKAILQPNKIGVCTGLIQFL